MSGNGTSGNGSGSAPSISSVANADDLFDDAESDGIITEDSKGVLTGSMDDLVVEGADGTDYRELEPDLLTLVTVMVDVSSSIANRGLADAVRDAYNQAVESLKDSRESDSILMATWLFNHDQEVRHSYVPLDEVEKLDDQNYRPSGQTSLYDTTCKASSACMSYAQTLWNNGQDYRSILLIVTDGEDVGSDRTPDDCKDVITDFLASEKFFTGFIGVGSEVDFEHYAREMGIPEGSILVAEDATESEIRQVFNLASESISSVSTGQIQPGQNSNFF